MRRPHATGTESLVGTTGVVVSTLSPQGQVRLHGETWRARTEGDDLPKDEPVEVLGTEGLTLIVRRLEQSQTPIPKNRARDRWRVMVKHSRDHRRSGGLGDHHPVRGDQGLSRVPAGRHLPAGTH